MEVLQNIGSSNSLQSHINPSSISENGGVSDNHTTTPVDSTNSITTQDSVDDITENALFELHDLAEGHTVSSEKSSAADLILGNDSNPAGDPLVIDEGEQPLVVEESPEVNIAINNVVCTFSTRCHLNLREIALNGENVELKKAQGMLNMKIRKPSATASIWSSGKVTVTGANSEENCKIAARKVARKLQRMGFDVKFSSFKIVNVLGTCSLPFGILLNDFSSENIDKVSYEPELHPGATYSIKEIRATLKIFSTGSITVTAPKVENIQLAIENVFPLVYPFKKPKPKKADPKEIKYIESELYDSSDAEMISDNSDLDLEPGEIPSTKSKTFSGLSRNRGRGGRRPPAPARVERVINADDYGSSNSDDDMDDDSD